MSEASKAVFLSYASQDSEAAKKICDALRAAGVEVWFDQSELRGGDAWDQKIRKQIRECALFVPVISANTQARPEGYFRLEWKLAVDRSHLMADDHSFIFPVVIDDTPEVAARVPDKFREVQWTRLRQGCGGQARIGSAEALPAFCERVQGLLAGEVAPVSGRRSTVREALPAGQRPAPPSDLRRRLSPVWLVVIIPVGVTLLALGALTVKRLRDSWAPPAGSPATRTALAPVGEFPRDPELRRALQLIFAIESTEEDYALAESMVKGVLATRPNDPEAIIAFADINNWYFARYFDLSDERLAQARRYSEWAAQLAPEHPAALAVLGHHFTLRQSDPPRARRLLERVVALAPGEPRYHRLLGNVVYLIDPAAGIAVAQEGVRRFPRDVLTRYELALLYRNNRQLAEMEQALDDAIAIAPLVNALMWKARLRLWRHGDAAGAMALIDQVPERGRQTSRVVATRFLQAAMGGNIPAALQALRALPKNIMEDFDGTAKSIVMGELLLLQGEVAQARLQFESGLLLMQQQLSGNPASLGLRNAEIWARLRLGQTDAARVAAASLVTTLRRPYRLPINTDWWFSPIPLHFLLDERGTAMQLIKEAAEDANGRVMLRHAFALDPRMAPWRHDPTITALLAAP